MGRGRCQYALKGYLGGRNYGVIFNKSQILGTLEEYILETNIFVLLKE